MKNNSDVNISLGKELIAACTEGALDKIKNIIVKANLPTENLSTLLDFVDDDNRTALHWAAVKGHDIIVDFLIKSGAKPDTHDDTGWTPLISASASGKIDVVKLLLSIPVNSNSCTDNGRNSLHYACSKGFDKIVELLLKAGCNPTCKAVDGSQPIHRAAACGNEKIAALLIEKSKGCVNAQNSQKETPLHISIQEGHRQFTLFLVSEGASLEYKDVNNKTPYDYANEGLKNDHEIKHLCR